jgi:hypothetical protein
MFPLLKLQTTNNQLFRRRGQIPNRECGADFGAVYTNLTSILLESAMDPKDGFPRNDDQQDCLSERLWFRSSSKLTASDEWTWPFWRQE